MTTDVLPLPSSRAASRLLKSFRSSELLPGSFEDVSERFCDLVEFTLRCNERRRELHDRITPVVGAADQIS
jgi:hypothetical protein